MHVLSSDDGQNWKLEQTINMGSDLREPRFLSFNGKLPNRGFVRQEQVKFDEFLTNRFGKCYACTAPDLVVKSGARIGV